MARKCGHVHVKRCQEDYMKTLPDTFQDSIDGTNALMSMTHPGCIVCSQEIIPNNIINIHGKALKHVQYTPDLKNYMPPLSRPNNRSNQQQQESQQPRIPRGRPLDRHRTQYEGRDRDRHSGHRRPRSYDWDPQDRHPRDRRRHGRSSDRFYGQGQGRHRNY